MTTNLNEIEINGVKYVPKGTQSSPAFPDGDIVLVRTQSAGVFYGTRTSGSDKLEHGIIELANARRVWYWSGAASLSQLAMEGTKKPGECKFPCPVTTITLLGVLEVIPVTTQALASLNSVKVWQQ